MLFAVWSAALDCCRDETTVITWVWKAGDSISERWEVRFGSLQYAVFEPGTRNTGTAIAGKNIANPIAMLNAAVDMLDHLGHKVYADAISDSINKTISEDRVYTPG